MSSPEQSYRQILRSSSIIGGGAVINVVVGLARSKAMAVMLGPAGVGLIGLYANLMSTAATMAGLGIGSVGTRQIAEAASQREDEAVDVVRRALFIATVVLSAAGALAVWLLRRPLARWVFNDPGHANDVAWLGAGVALMTAAASQNALLNGLRRIGDLARVTVLGGIAGTCLGLAALWMKGDDGVVAFVIVGPLATFMLGYFYAAKARPVLRKDVRFGRLFHEWRALVRLGVPFMLAGLTGTGAQLLVRTMVRRRLGLAELGFFQASWSISMTYITFVLGAMGTDFYPRLTAVIQDRQRVNRLINEQTEVAILLASPIILAMLGLSPWVIHLLYAPSFAPAAGVLRWQIMGDILKLVSWPIAFVLLASGEGTTFLLAELSAFSLFALVTGTLLAAAGIEATGVGFLAMYVWYLPLVFWLARRRTGFRWEGKVAVLVAGLLLCGGGTFAAAMTGPTAGMLVGLACASGFALIAMLRLSQMLAIGGIVGKIAARAHKHARKVVTEP